MANKEKVAVAMSGGVDSSLAAALLVGQGYDVVGVTMRLADNSRDFDAEHDRGCCSLSAVEDARHVAEILGIPHYVLDFRALFREKVMADFVSAYARGRTPNPCIACNRYVKFRGLLEKALGIGAQYVATGHYARVGQDSEGHFVLRKGIDEKKDQSYALYPLDQEALRHVLLPLGEHTKAQARALAEQMGLPVAHKPDSQEICFVPHDDYRAYLREHAPQCLLPGDIVDARGAVLGAHAGVPLYTIGQRKGLGIAAPEPLYVMRLDVENRRVVVGGKDDVFFDGLIAGDMCWVSGAQPSAPFRAAAKIRYGKREAMADILPLPDGRVNVRFDEPQRAVTPGQSVVFYDGDIVLGGGIIDEAVHHHGEDVQRGI